MWLGSKDPSFFTSDGGIKKTIFNWRWITKNGIRFRLITIEDRTNSYEKYPEGEVYP